MKFTVSLGTIISGSHRPEDLIPAFTGELKRLDVEGNHKALIQDAEGLEAFDTEEAGEVLDALFDSLDAFAPSFCYFGAIDGDGADFGFWFDRASFEEAQYCNEVATGSDLAEAKQRATSMEADYLAVVSDHGNLELYDINENLLLSLV